MSDIALPLNRLPVPARGGRVLGDERLAKLAGRGSERAFAVLYERHHQALYRYCRSIVHNEQDAQDALQNAMMRAYAALRSEQRELAVKPWLFRIAHNEAISLLRKRRPEQELSEESVQPGGDVQGRVEVRERLSTLVKDLQALPERQRGALVMRELSGLSIQQIAQALGMSPGAAKQTLFEARSSLHELSEGRAMQCESVMKAISQRDGRVLRSRRIRSHLLECEECRAFRSAISTRSADLALIAPPLPASLASALLGSLLAHGGGYSGAAGSGATAAASGATAAGSGGSLGGHVVASLLGKGLAGVAVVAAATAGAVHFTGSSRTTASRHHRGVVEQSRAGAGAGLGSGGESSALGGSSLASGDGGGASGEGTTSTGAGSKANSRVTAISPHGRFGLSSLQGTGTGAGAGGAGVLGGGSRGSSSGIPSGGMPAHGNRRESPLVSGRSGARQMGSRKPLSPHRLTGNRHSNKAHARAPMRRPRSLGGRGRRTGSSSPRPTRPKGSEASPTAGGEASTRAQHTGEAPPTRSAKA